LWPLPDLVYYNPFQPIFHGSFPMTQSKYPRLVFMGTPDFAVPALRSLLDAGEELVAVYTQPDRPKGRGRKFTPSPVKELAMAHNLSLFQPRTLKESSAANSLAELKPDLLIVVAYGLILPPSVLSIPNWGAVNIHASLLPKYRGAAPIQWAIINGEKETGVTTMRLDSGIDTGDILLQQAVPVLAEDTSGTLHDRLSTLGADLLRKTLEVLRQGNLVPQPQDSVRATKAPPLKKEQGEIRWGLPAKEIDCWIRGLSPWPGAFTFIRGKRLIIHRAYPEAAAGSGRPGSIDFLERGLVRVNTGRGNLVISEAQLEGHRRMASAEMARGLSLQAGETLGR
jgi:methionyl-tRNA formyltransferase